MADGVSTSLDRITQSSTLTPVLLASDEGSFYINGFDEILIQIENAKENIASLEFTEDDRKAIKEARAYVNKLSGHIASAIKEAKSHTFDEVDRQKKILTAEFGELVDMLKTSLDEFDQRVRQEKIERAKLIFQDSLDLIDDENLEGVEFEDIENGSWGNRSADERKTTKEISSRLKSIQSLLGLSDETLPLDVKKSASYLDDNDWDLGPALRDYRDDVEVEKEKIRKTEEDKERLRQELEAQKKREIEEARVQAAAAERLRIEEEEKKKAEKEAKRLAQNEFVSVKIEIPQGKLDELKKFVENLGGSIVEK